MNRKIGMIIEFLAYWLGVDAWLYWLNRKAKRVVAFHNVIPDEILQKEDCGGTCFGANRFRAAIREMKKHFRINADFDDPESLVITFDDGYVNQYEVAAKILKEEGDIPAAIFVAGSIIGSEGFENSLVVDRVEQWSVDAPLEVAEKLFNRKFSTRAQLWSEGVLPLFASDGEHKGQKTWETLEKTYSITRAVNRRNPEFVRLRFGGITQEQIQDLRNRGWKVGYHTYSHFPLSRLSNDEAQKELQPVDEAMREIPFAYPYGNVDFVSERDEKSVWELGYPSAYSCDADLHPRHGRFFLCRMMPPIDKYRLHFELSGLRHFLKYRRLLPRATK